SRSTRGRVACPRAPSRARACSFSLRTPHVTRRVLPQPSLSNTLTVAPSGSRLPGSGLTAATLPSGWSERTPELEIFTEYPASSNVVIASAWLCPITFGTLWSSLVGPASSSALGDLGEEVDAHRGGAEGSLPCSRPAWASRTVSCQIGPGIAPP